MGEDVNHMVVDGETRGDHFSVHKCSITVIYTWNNIIIIIIEAVHRLWVKVRRLAKSQGSTDHCDERCHSCIHCWCGQEKFQWVQHGILPYGWPKFIGDIIKEHNGYKRVGRAACWEGQVNSSRNSGNGEMACGEGDLLPYHHLSHSSRVSVLSRIFLTQLTFAQNTCPSPLLLTFCLSFKDLPTTMVSSFSQLSWENWGGHSSRLTTVFGIITSIAKLWLVVYTWWRNPTRSHICLRLPRTLHSVQYLWMPNQYFKKYFILFIYSGYVRS